MVSTYRCFNKVFWQRLCPPLMRQTSAFVDELVADTHICHKCSLPLVERHSPPTKMAEIWSWVTGGWDDLSR